jgi:hypothetical protein
MLIPICAQFHYAYGDSPYAKFSGSPHVHIWGLPVCIRGSVSDVSAIFPRDTRESEFSRASRNESEFCECTTSCTCHIQNRSHDMKSLYAYGDQDQSPYAYGDCMSWDPRMHTGIKINPRMHTEIAEIPVCIWGLHDT